MLICLICALKGKVVSLRIMRNKADGHDWLYTYCRGCRHDGFYPPLAER
jgi:hypothetical protein